MSDQLARLAHKKQQGEKIVMLTAYDYPLAALVDACGVDIVLVGDSLANVVLGLESTRAVGITEMLHHAKAVRRAVRTALLVGDMPYASYQLDLRQAVTDARRFVDEAGCDAVKLEWFEQCLAVAGEIIAAGIPVMGHVGLTPQTAEELGGFKVQGRDAEAAQRIIRQARAFADQGCFAVVLECVPDRLARLITQQLPIPTIGIGAGPHCDGQVLVMHDLVGLFDRYQPKFVKRYVDAGALIQEGIRRFQAEVRDGLFPDRAHSYTLSDEEFLKIQDS